MIKFALMMIQVIQFETKLAEITTPASKMRDGENRSLLISKVSIKFEEKFIISQSKFSITWQELIS